jgi:hopanoid biosynthesis associated RND transporter like protein HpnN
MEALVGGAVAGLVDGARRRAAAVAAVYLIATLAAAAYTARHLGFNTDGKSLLPPDLLSRDAAKAFERSFPSLDDALLVVVDAESPEAARNGARALAARLRARPDRFANVVAPGTDEFFERQGLLYLDRKDLERLAAALARAQPMLFNLERVPRLDTLRHLLQFGIGRPPLVMGDPAQWSMLLDQIRAAAERSFDERPAALSWERLMVADGAFAVGRRQVLMVEPVLEFGALLPAGRALAAIRAEAADLGLTAERGARVRITGNPALNHEEMLGLAWGMGYSVASSFALVVALLFLAFRSLRLVAAAALNLGVGLVWTAAFAAVAIGHLNIISIAFAILFIGLGIDFAIHLGMHYVAAARRAASGAAALTEAARTTGTSLVLCAGTTAIGFYAFVPTDYRGVAELGVIAGTGMLVILVQTLVLFPALVTLFLGDAPGARLRPALDLRLRPPAGLLRHPGTVVLVAGCISVVAALAARRVSFDCNVVAMRDPGSESVETFRDLLADSATSPWSVDVLAPSLAEAETLASRLRAVPEVASAVTAADYVPSGQDEKRALLAEVASLFVAPTAAGAAPPGAEERGEAIRKIRAVLARVLDRTDAASALRASAARLDAELDQFLRRAESSPDRARALERLEKLLLEGIAAQVARLRAALAPAVVTLETLPPALVRHRVAPDGHARVEVQPRENVGDAAALARFVDAVRRIAPDATGVGVNVLEFGRATVRSFREAFALAFAAIALFVWSIWRRVTETALVLAPLLLCSLWTLGAMAVLGMDFNFANVIVLPLLLGMNVDSGIHLVSLSSKVGADAATLLDTITARAVFYSAATTIVSVANLAFAAHRGIASMGLLLVCGLVLMLLGNLVVLPALIALRARFNGS